MVCCVQRKVYDQGILGQDELMVACNLMKPDNVVKDWWYRFMWIPNSSIKNSDTEIWNPNLKKKVTAKLRQG